MSCPSSPDFSRTSRYLPPVVQPLPFGQGVITPWAIPEGYSLVIHRNGSYSFQPMNVPSQQNALQQVTPQQVTPQPQLSADASVQTELTGRHNAVMYFGEVRVEGTADDLRDFLRGRQTDNVSKSSSDEETETDPIAPSGESSTAVSREGEAKPHNYDSEFFPLPVIAETELTPISLNPVFDLVQLDNDPSVNETVDATSEANTNKPKQQTLFAQSISDDLVSEIVNAAFTQAKKSVSDYSYSFNGFVGKYSGRINAEGKPEGQGVWKKNQKGIPISEINAQWENGKPIFGTVKFTHQGKLTFSNGNLLTAEKLIRPDGSEYVGPVNGKGQPHTVGDQVGTLSWFDEEAGQNKSFTGKFDSGNQVEPPKPLAPKPQRRIAQKNWVQASSKEIQQPQVVVAEDQNSVSPGGLQSEATIITPVETQKSEEPKAEEPKAEEPKAEEPKAEKPLPVKIEQTERKERPIESSIKPASSKSVIAPPANAVVPAETASSTAASSAIVPSPVVIDPTLAPGIHRLPHGKTLIRYYSEEVAKQRVHSLYQLVACAQEMRDSIDLSSRNDSAVLLAARLVSDAARRVYTLSKRVICTQITLDNPANPLQGSVRLQGYIAGLSDQAPLDLMGHFQQLPSGGLTFMPYPRDVLFQFPEPIQELRNTLSVNCVHEAVSRGEYTLRVFKPQPAAESAPPQVVSKKAAKLSAKSAKPTVKSDKTCWGELRREGHFYYLGRLGPSVGLARAQFNLDWLPDGPGILISQQGHIMVGVFSALIQARDIQIIPTFTGYLLWNGAGVLVNPSDGAAPYNAFSKENGSGKVTVYRAKGDAQLAAERFLKGACGRIQQAQSSKWKGSVIPEAEITQSWASCYEGHVERGGWQLHPVVNEIDDVELIAALQKASPTLGESLHFIPLPRFELPANAGDELVPDLMLDLMRCNFSLSSAVPIEVLMAESQRKSRGGVTSECLTMGTWKHQGPFDQGIATTFQPITIIDEGVNGLDNRLVYQGDFYSATGRPRKGTFYGANHQVYDGLFTDEVDSKFTGLAGVVMNGKPDLKEVVTEPVSMAAREPQFAQLRLIFNVA